MVKGSKEGAQEANKECLTVRMRNKAVGHVACKAPCVPFMITLQRNITKFVNAGESLHGSLLHYSLVFSALCKLFRIQNRT